MPASKTDEAALRQQLRQLIERNCGSVNRACLEAGLQTSTIYRFFAGKRGINWQTLVALLAQCEIEFRSLKSEDPTRSNS